ncbi:MAG: hypothetical protein KAT53_05450, partial [Dehalococcoidia bacterium]|nr:hypothetical protein [Dehalococcoidia bacterium]
MPLRYLADRQHVATPVTFRHCEPFAFFHAEGAKRVENLAKGKLREAILFTILPSFEIASVF